MIDFTHILAALPHPSDLGLVKPGGGFQAIPAILGLITFFGASQFIYYSDDSRRVDPWAKRD